MRILIVEDHQGIRLALEMVLQLEGYETLSVDRGEAALEILQTKSADLILLDLNTNGITAYDFAAKLGALSDGRGEAKPPVILISGSQRLANEAAQIGAHSHFSKPFEVDDLVAHIRRIAEEQAALRPSISA